ncbi:MAG: carbonic anhydrase [Candidatus Brocadiia bacterium]
MSLEQFIKVSREFMKNTPAQSLSEIKSRCRWAIVTCTCCELMDFINKALGLKRGEAVFIQNAGNTITSFDNSVLRSLAVAIYVVGAKEVAIIGHTHCGMRIDVAKLTDSFKKYNKTREMIKADDLREWFGVINDEENNVRKVVESVRQSDIIPQEIPVYGLMINSETGELKEVHHSLAQTTQAGVVHTETEIPTADLAQDEAHRLVAQQSARPRPAQQQPARTDGRSGGTTGKPDSFEDFAKQITNPAKGNQPRPKRLR